MLMDGMGGELRKLFDAGALPGPAVDPRMSADGSLVAFVCEKEIYVVGTAPGSGVVPVVPRQLTHDARGTAKTNGLADFIAQEELGRFEGLWVSSDGSKIAFEQSDESHIPQYRIMHQGNDAVGADAQEDHHYPFAGQDNPLQKLGVVDVATGTVSWMNIDAPFGPDMYLGRVKWLPCGRLTAQIINRKQSELYLMRFDLDASSEAQALDKVHKVAGEVLVREVRDTAWMNVHNILVPLSGDGGGGGGFIWASERSGFRHLYQYDEAAPANLVAQLTEGDWMVEDLADGMVDEAAGVLHCTGTKDSPLECHLYRVPLSGGGEPVRVTLEDGMHSILAVDHAKAQFIDMNSSLETPFRVDVCSLKDGALIRTIYDGSTDAKVASLGAALAPPTPFQIRSGDDAVDLHGVLYTPDSSMHGSGPYPTLVSVYGGPHAQMVTNAWTCTADLRAQRLRSQGYLIIKLDNRGADRRGLAFEGALQHDMGNVEVTDQVSAVEHCIANGLAEKGRVGIYGWSYGGYMSAMCLAKRPDVFSAAVAGAPVSHWDGYDTCYTERYMGTPQSNPDGYARSAVMAHVDGIDGSLLLVHGLIDENVHFRHTARLINALIKAQKHYELLMFPNERHVPRGLADKVFMEQRIANFLERSL